jgi:hypothetical protein
MKQYIFLIAYTFTGTIFAQENNPKLEAVGQLVKQHTILKWKSTTRRFL